MVTCPGARLFPRLGQAIHVSSADWFKCNIRFSCDWLEQTMVLVIGHPVKTPVC